MLESEKNIYGLTDTVIEVCKFLGLTLPEKTLNKMLPVGEKLPSDYFGEDFELNEKMIRKLSRARKKTNDVVLKYHKRFSKKFSTQKNLKQNKTDINIFFCDYFLFSGKKGYTIVNYFDFEFYNKSQAIQDSFVGNTHLLKMHVLCNDYLTSELLTNKSISNRYGLVY